MWPKELTQHELLYLPGKIVRWTETTVKKTTKMEVLGLVWDDDELEYAIYLFDPTLKRPDTLKEVVEFVNFNDKFDDKGVIIRFGILSFDYLDLV